MMSVFKASVLLLPGERSSSPRIYLHHQPDIPAHARGKHKIKTIPLGGTTPSCHAAHVKKRSVPLSEGSDALIQIISQRLNDDRAEG